MNTIKLNTIGEAPVKKVAGDGGNGGGDEWHYYKLTTPLKMAAAAPAETGLLTLIKCRVKSSGTTFVCGTFSNELFELIGFAADYDSIVTDPRGLDVTAYTTLRDLIQAVGGYEAMFGEGAVTEITKEEFYKILPVFAIRFSDGTKNYTYEEGMTWGEWVNSSYNTIGAYVNDENVLVEQYTVIRDRTTGDWMKASDLIQSNTVYDYSGTIPM